MPREKKHISIDEALSKARRYCAYQERCHFDVESKLKSLGLHYEFIPSICVKLVEEGYLSEERFVSAFVRGKFNQKKWGIQKIKIALQQKQISPKLIEWGLQEIDTAKYKSELIRILEKKREKLNAHPKEIKDKLWRYARQKGYESSLIAEALDEILNN